jgi:hypothetical protein
MENTKSFRIPVRRLERDFRLYVFGEVTSNAANIWQTNKSCPIKPVLSTVFCMPKRSRTALKVASLML